MAQVVLSRFFPFNYKLVLTWLLDKDFKYVSGIYVFNKQGGAIMKVERWEIIKRDGRKTFFDSSKITQAILKAGRVTGELDEEVARSLTVCILTVIQNMVTDSSCTVEEIQDIVENTLLNSPFKKTAKAYVLYRDQHARIREIAKHKQLDLIDSYLKKEDWRVQENSNMSYSLQGLNNYISNEVSQSYWLNKIYTQEVREAHYTGDFHIHDLGQLSVYCVGWDLQDLLRSGFCGVEGKIASYPAKHFRTALGQIVNFFYTLQGEAAGAQAFSNFDTLLAPFIYYDNLSYAEIKQALQEFIFNVNVPTRVGFQSPFTNVTIDLQSPKNLSNQSVIIGGELQDKTYSEFQHEMNMFNQAFLEVLAAGDANGRVFTFPIPTYNITPEFNWENPELEKLWEVTAKYGIPYFANFVNSNMSADDARSMCCRLRIDNRVLEKRGGGLFGANPLTGSIGVVTINMPRIGLLAKDEEDFFNRLSRLMEIAKTSLETKRKVLERLTDGGLYPYIRFYLRDIKKQHGVFWHNHFSTIGLIGMNEACVNFLQEDIGSVKGIKFANKVLDFMRETLTSFQQETNHFYNLEATPAESTTYRLAKLDQKRYPKEIKQNLKSSSDIPFYTNSSQLPVNYTDDVFKMLDLQDELQAKYTGGTVLHIFLGEEVVDALSVKQFVKKICDDYKAPYFSITPTFSICPTHGYLTGKQERCFHCDAKTEIYSRVVGYLRPVEQWNEGKREEFKARKLYKIDKKT